MTQKTFLVLPIAFFLVHCVPAHSLPQSASTEVALREPSPPLFNPSSQSRIIGTLMRELGEEVSVPSFTGSEVYDWCNVRWPQDGTDPKVNLRFVVEALLLSQQLLQRDNDEATRREGLKLARQTTAYAYVNMPDHPKLAADIVSGFLYPNILLGNIVRWRDCSREDIIESSAACFARAGRRDHQQAAFEWLLQLANPKDDKTKVTSSTRLFSTDPAYKFRFVPPQFDEPLVNLANRDSVNLSIIMVTRGKLAYSMMQDPNATKDDLHRAMILLKQVKSTDEGSLMDGFIDLRKKLAERIEKEDRLPGGSYYRFPYKTRTTN